MSRNDLSKSEPWDTNYPVKALSHPLAHAASFSGRPKSVFWLPIKTTMTQGILFLVNFSPDLRNQIHIFFLRPGVVDALKSTTMKLHFFRCFE